MIEEEGERKKGRERRSGGRGEKGREEVSEGEKKVLSPIHPPTQGMHARKGAREGVR